MVSAVVVGLLVSAQSRINASLAEEFAAAGEGDTQAAIHAAAISFATGLVLVLAIVLLSPSLRRTSHGVVAALRLGSLRPWYLLGGMGGAWLVTTQGLTVPTLGVAPFLVAVVAGQSMGSIFVDGIGLGPLGRIHPTARRVLAAGLALVGVAIAVAPRLGAVDGVSLEVLVLAALALSAGVGVSVQQALNGRVAVAAGRPLSAAAVNFTVGFTTVVLVLGLAMLVSGGQLAPLPDALWLYVGGPLGVAFIVIAAWVVPLVGVLRFALAAISGQLLGGAILDLLAPLGDVTLAPLTLVGIVVAFLGVVVANRR